MNAPRHVVFVFAMWVLWITPVTLSGQQPRTFTNHAGKTLSAIPLRLGDGKVEVKRMSDGLVVQIPLTTLSAADQAWLASWAANAPAQTPAAMPGGWSVLRVHCPISDTGSTRPKVIGLASDAARIGSSTFELILPRGAWVEVTVVDYAVTGRYLEHLIRFEGEREWTLSADGPLLLLSRDGGTPKVAGITLSNNNPEKLLAAVDLARCEPEVSLDISSSDLKVPELAKFKVGALIVGSVVDGEDLASAVALRPKALRVHLTEATAGKIDRFTSLEAMILRRDRACPATALGTLPPARDMSIHSFAFTPTMQQSLAANTGLRMLHFYESESGKAGVLQWKGLSKNTNLEALHMLRGVELDAADVARLPNLRSFHYNDFAFPKGAANLDDLAQLTGLIDLELDELIPPFPPEVFEEWTKSGGLKNLVRFVTDRHHSVEGMPNLRVLDMSLPQEERRHIVSGIGALSDLRSLTLSGVGKSDMPALTSAKNRGMIESLDLRLRKHYVLGKLEFGSDYVDSKDLGRLAGYTNLKRLEISGGNISQFDLGPFPSLEALRLRDMDELEQVMALTSSPSLEVIEIEDCKMLRGLGTKAPNTKLRLLELRDCPELADITALHQTTGLQFISINRCGKIPEPLTLEKINPLYKLSVSSCALLQDRYIRLRSPVP